MVFVHSSEICIDIPMILPGDGQAHLDQMYFRSVKTFPEKSKINLSPNIQIFFHFWSKFKYILNFAYLIDLDALTKAICFSANL